MSACGTRKVKVKTEKFAVTAFHLDVFTSDGNRSFSQCFRVVFGTRRLILIIRNTGKFYKIILVNLRYRLKVGNNDCLREDLQAFLCLHPGWLAE
jgi:hypothetical protein